MMKTSLVVVLLTVASVTFADDGFVRKFAYTQVMAKCLGEKEYYSFLEQSINAAKACYQEPMKMLPGHSGSHKDQQQTNLPSDLAGLFRGERPVLLPLIIPQGEGGARLPFNIPYNLFSQRQKRSVLYDAPLMKHLMTKALSKVSNFTCVLKKLDVLDENLNLQYEVMKEQVKDLTPSPILNQDLVKMIDHCKNFVTCLPEEDKSPMPVQIKKALVFLKCDKKMRMAICMKHDILNYLEIFDVSALPFKTEDEEELAEKLLHVFWGAESKEDFEVY